MTYDASSNLLNNRLALGIKNGLDAELAGEIISIRRNRPSSTDNIVESLGNTILYKVRNEDNPEDTIYGVEDIFRGENGRVVVMRDTIKFSDNKVQTFSGPEEGWIDMDVNETTRLFERVERWSSERSIKAESSKGFFGRILSKITGIANPASTQG